MDLRALPEYAQDIAMVDLAAFAGAPQCARPGGPVEAHQEEVAREYLQRAEEFDRKVGTPGGVEGPMTKKMKSYGSRVLVPVIAAFAEMSSDVEALADVTASALAADHIQFFSTSAEEAKGMYKQRIQTACGHCGDGPSSSTNPSGGAMFLITASALNDGVLVGHGPAPTEAPNGPPPSSSSPSLSP